jgi:TolB-like protein
LLAISVDVSSDPEQEYFSDGIAGEVVTELSRRRALFVIVRNFGTTLCITQRLRKRTDRTSEQSAPAGAPE